MKRTDIKEADARLSQAIQDAVSFFTAETGLLVETTGFKVERVISRFPGDPERIRYHVNPTYSIQ